MLNNRYQPMLKRCVCLFLAGTALQLLFGGINPSFLAYPWGVVLAVNYIYLLILLRTNANKWKWVNHLYDRPAYITSLASLLALTLLFGLIRQDDSSDGWAGTLGFTQMSSSWIFNLFLLQFMTSMGMKAIDDIYLWRKRKLTNLIMHVSFFILLMASIFGSGDKIRVHVNTAIGHPIQTGITTNGKTTSLPFTLVLKKFSLDEYPPKVHLYNKGIWSEEFVMMKEEGSEGKLGKWQVECLEYIEHAGRLSEDSAFTAMNHVGTTTAIRIKAFHSDTHQTIEGWVSCGSHIFVGSTLSLPDGSELVMPRREAKKYLSEIEVTTEESKKTYQISVNHPASIGSWKIYQSGYDSARGRWSTTSTLECVKDSWYIPVHLAMWMILIAGIMMFILGWKEQRKEEKK